MRADPTVRIYVPEGAPPYLLQWMEDDGEEGERKFKWDAIDGGTTVTVVAVLRGVTALVASLGDSAAVLLSREREGRGAGGRRGGEVKTELMIAEHSPTNLNEYIRMRAAGTSQVKFVYDCPDFSEFNIFRDDANGSPILDLNAQARAPLPPTWRALTLIRVLTLTRQ